MKRGRLFGDSSSQVVERAGRFFNLMVFGLTRSNTLYIKAALYNPDDRYYNEKVMNNKQQVHAVPKKYSGGARGNRKSPDFGFWGGWFEANQPITPVPE